MLSEPLDDLTQTATLLLATHGLTAPLRYLWALVNDMKADPAGNAGEGCPFNLTDAVGFYSNLEHMCRLYDSIHAPRPSLVARSMD